MLTQHIDEFYKLMKVLMLILDVNFVLEKI